ncbi:hypothetical protein DBR27_21870 [Flavobacterium sp. HMWF030]|nr:hypothetical protein DBR27_21870 [Flavobacterium sp. HMWF030]
MQKISKALYTAAMLLLAAALASNAALYFSKGGIPETAKALNIMTPIVTLAYLLSVMIIYRRSKKNGRNGKR